MTVWQLKGLSHTWLNRWFLFTARWFYSKWDGLKISPICLLQCCDKISVPAIFSDHRYSHLCSATFSSERVGSSRSPNFEMSISRQENSQSIQTLLSGKQPLNSPSLLKRKLSAYSFHADPARIVCTIVCEACQNASFGDFWLSLAFLRVEAYKSLCVARNSEQLVKFSS